MRSGSGRSLSSYDRYAFARATDKGTQELSMKTGRVVTANLPLPLATQLDEAVNRLSRSRSWIIRLALADWLAEEQRRHELTLEALEDADAGRLLSQKEVERHFATRRETRAS